MALQVWDVNKYFSLFQNIINKNMDESMNDTEDKLTPTTPTKRSGTTLTSTITPKRFFSSFSPTQSPQASPSKFKSDITSKFYYFIILFYFSS